MAEMSYEVHRVPAEPGSKILLNFSPSGEHVEYDHIATQVIRRKEGDRTISQVEIPIVGDAQGQEKSASDLAFERGESVVWRGGLD